MTLLMIFPLSLNALEIEKVYSDIEIEIGGAIKVRSLINVSGSNEKLDYKVFIKDQSLKEFNGKKEDFESSAIYNGTNLEIKKIGELKNKDDINDFYNDTFTENNIEFIEKFDSKEDANYHIITLQSTKEETTYYLEYVITNILVEHNDSAEFYYKYFKDFGYDIKEIKILTRLPSTSKLFKVWAHGNKEWKVSKDITSGFVLLERQNYKKDEYLDLRILFDKELFVVNINESKKTNMDAIKIIEDIENKKQNSEKISNILKISFVTLTSLLLIAITSYIIFKRKKKHRK